MPLFAVKIKAEMENIESIAPMPQRRWGLKFLCTQCQTITENYHFIDETETAEEGGGKANAFFACKFCKKMMSATIDPKSYAAYTGGPKAMPVVVIEVRNGEPVELNVEALWVATASESGSAFAQCDLSQDWCDYDEVSAQSVSIMGVTVDFERRGK